MHPVAAVVWSVFTAYIAVLEWTDPWMQHTEWWLVALLYFAVFELVGGLRRHRGDMYSEALWTFASGKWGAKAFAASFAFYFAERLYMLGAPEGFWLLPMWLPRATLVVGFGVWLVVHVWTDGRHG
jgi:hypothetical protein